MSFQLPTPPSLPEEREAYVRHNAVPSTTWKGNCGTFLCRLWPKLCRLTTQVRQVAFRFDPECLEFQTGFMALALGTWWLSQPTLKSTNFGALLVRLWPAPLWASLFLLLGFIQIVSSTRNWMTARCICAMAGFWLWFFVAALLALEELPGPSISLFPIIALSEAWVYLRLRAHSDSTPCLENSTDENSNITQITQRT